MSIITDAVIVTVFSDDAAIEELNKYLLEYDNPDNGGRGQQFNKMDNTPSGGCKAPSMTVYQACFNHLPSYIIEDAFNKTKFDRKESFLILDCEIGGCSARMKGKELYEEEVCYY